MHTCSGYKRLLAGAALLVFAASLSAQVTVGASTLIQTLHYSDTFTAGDNNRVANGVNVTDSTALIVENTYGNDTRSWTSNLWSIADDATVDDGAGDPFSGSGAGSATGMTQSGAHTNYGIEYGLSNHFVIQFDAFQPVDRVNITASGTGVDSIAGGLSVFFRVTEHATYEIGLYDGTTEIDSGLASGIASTNVWHNYAVRFDLVTSVIEVYVDEVSLGIVDLLTLNGGSHNTASNAFVNVGTQITDFTRVYTDNFQVGTAAVPEPSTYAAIFGGLALVGTFIARRRKSEVVAG